MILWIHRKGSRHKLESKLYSWSVNFYRMGHLNIPIQIMDRNRQQSRYTIISAEPFFYLYVEKQVPNSFVSQARNRQATHKNVY